MPSEKSWTSHPELVSFYTTHRKHPEDLYDSERRFLPWLADQANSVLDVGCAAGGFLNIWRAYRPDIKYTGVDVSAPLVEAARKLHPDVDFLVGDCSSGLLLNDGYADIVQALGWLHLEKGYDEALSELWRLCKRYMFFDLRLLPTPSPELLGRQRIAFSKEWDGKSIWPYVVVPVEKIASKLLSLRPKTILGYGYLGKPAPTVEGVGSEICFATFVLEKSTPDSPNAYPAVCMDMPLEWPASVSAKVNLLPSLDLVKLVPQTSGKS